jgi:hypothetical protein
MKLFKFAIVSILLMGFVGCESVKEDARNTPIGSVMTGETKSTDSYIERVTKTNRSLDKDTWRPESRERF